MKTNSETEDIYNGQKIDKLLTPSWISGLIAVVAGLVVSVGVILAFNFHNSQIQLQLTDLQNTSSPALTLPGQAPPGSTVNSLQNTWPLMGFWAVIGLIVYIIVESILKILSDAAEISRELNYVHARRDLLLKTTAEYLLLRLIVVAVWLLFINVFFRRIIPYSIIAANASASDLLSISGVLYALLSFSMIAFGVHLHTIFLRLSLRRPRVFSNR